MADLQAKSDGAGSEAVVLVPVRVLRQYRAELIKLAHKHGAFAENKAWTVRETKFTHRGKRNAFQDAEELLVDTLRAAGVTL